jgi:hypothetical protein
MEPGAGRLPLAHALDDVNRDLPPIQGAGERETGDSGSDDQDPQRRYARGRLF